jgi:subtilase family serine protease
MRITYTNVLIVAIISALTACSGSAGYSPQPAQDRALQSHSVDAPFVYRVHPHAHFIGNVFLHNCAGLGSGDCLTPTTIKDGYNFASLPSTANGSGQKIVIVDAYGSPTISNDLKTFDKQFGLPDPTLTIVYPGGKPSVNLSNATQLGWAEETSLDVEWAHAAAPGAQIVLVVSNNDQGSTLQSTLLYAATNYPGSAMSLSFGVQELSINGGANNTQLQQSSQVYATAANNKVTVIAAAGDFGAIGGFTAANPQYPASDPHVLAVGGTNLTLFHNGNYRNESVWNDADNCLSPCVLGADGATGGAASTIFGDGLLPTQHAVAALSGITNTMRKVSDVAYNASPNTGVVVYIGFTAKGISPGYYAVGGTSQGPPQYAGIVAIANQLRQTKCGAPCPLGWITDKVYQIYQNAQTTKSPPFHDVITGDNKFPLGQTGFLASAGYDYPTGLGSPNVTNLVNALVALP